MEPWRVFVCLGVLVMGTQGALSPFWDASAPFQPHVVYKVTEAEECERRETCDACLAHEACGWCAFEENRGCRNSTSTTLGEEDFCFPELWYDTQCPEECQPIDEGVITAFVFNVDRTVIVHAAWDGFGTEHLSFTGDLRHRYEWALGFASGDSSIMPFTDVGAATSLTNAVLPGILPMRTTFWLSVRLIDACNTHALASRPATTSQPPCGSTMVGVVTDFTISDNRLSIDASWADFNSSTTLSDYQWGLGTAAHSLPELVSVPLTTTSITHQLDNALTGGGTSYYFYVLARDVCGSSTFYAMAVARAYCDRGEMWSQPHGECRPCDPGSYTDERAQVVCKPCPPGEDASMFGSIQCDPCRPGTFSFANGTSECLECAEGHFQNRFHQISCEPCPPGEANEKIGQKTCVVCRPGSYSVGGQERCTSCMPGSYQDSSAQTSCQACPQNTTTATVAADSLLDCTCTEGYYDPSGETGNACLICPTGGVCDGETTQPIAAPGFWGDSPNFFVCPGGPRICLGGADGGLCRLGSGGTYCGECVDGYSRIGSMCEKCPTGSGGFLAFIYLAVLVFVFTAMFWVAKAPPILNALFITLNGLQLTVLLASFDLNFPDGLIKFLNGLSIVNLNVDLAFTDCSWKFSYIQKYYWTLCIPFLFTGYWGVIMLLYHWIRVKFARSEGENFRLTNPSFCEPADHLSSLTAQLRYRISLLLTEPPSNREVVEFFDTVYGAFVAFLSFSYAFLMAKSLEVFDCTDVGNGEAALNVNPSITCWEGEHKKLVPVACIFVTLYTLGIPVFFYYQLRKRDTEDDRYRRRYGFLYLRYEQAWHSYELAIIVRKLLFVVAIRFGTRVDLLQATFALLVVFFALNLQTFAAPHLFTSNDRVEFSGLCTTFLLVFSGLVFRIDMFPSDDARGGTAVVVTLVMCISILLFFTLFLLDIRAFLRIRKTVGNNNNNGGDSEHNQKLVQFHAPLAKSFPFVFEWLSTASDAERELIWKVYESIRASRRDDRIRADDYFFYNRILLSFPFGIAWLVNASDEDRKRFLEYGQAIHLYQWKNKWPSPLSKVPGFRPKTELFRNRLLEDMNEKLRAKGGPSATVPIELELDNDADVNPEVLQKWRHRVQCLKEEQATLEEQTESVDKALLELQEEVEWWRVQHGDLQVEEGARVEESSKPSTTQRSDLQNLEELTGGEVEVETVLEDEGAIELWNEIRALKESIQHAENQLKEEDGNVHWWEKRVKELNEELRTKEAELEKWEGVLKDEDVWAAPLPKSALNEAEAEADAWEHAVERLQQELTGLEQDLTRCGLSLH